MDKSNILLVGNEKERDIGKVEIYYFSGTGNSLVVARDIARKTNGKLIPIPSVIDKESIETDAYVIGIVFPVFYADFNGIPLIVKRFVEKMHTNKDTYIFTICTHSGKPGRTIERFDDLLNPQGLKLASGFTVKMSVPYSVRIKIGHAFFHMKLNPEQAIIDDSNAQEKLYVVWKNKCEIITKHVSDRNHGIFETSGFFSKAISALFLPLLKYIFHSHYEKLANVATKKAKGFVKYTFEELIQLADNSFKVNEKCNGCGTCAKICPVNNIKMIENRPEWQHHCETCYACYTWCPHNAIFGEIVAYNKKYHHPDVKISDMLMQRKKVKKQ